MSARVIVARAIKARTLLGFVWRKVRQGVDGNMCGARWSLFDELDVPTGYYVQHCGHPTAHRPYYVENPAKGWTHAHKFASVVEARGAAEIHLHLERIGVH